LTHYRLLLVRFSREITLSRGKVYSSLIALSWLMACGGEDYQSHRHQQILPGNAGDAIANPVNPEQSPQGGSPEADPPEATDETEEAPEGDTGGGTVPFDGRAFFLAEVEPQFQKDCQSCHAEPRIPVPERGPLSIYSYDAMAKKLNPGDKSTSNYLIDKMTAKRAHEGGNVCPGGVMSGPCLKVVEWLKGEFAETESQTPPGGGAGGKISSVSDVGLVAGYAADDQDLTNQLVVKFYVDGDATTGELAGETVADKSGFDDGKTGNHAFSFSLPDSFRNGVERTIYAYGEVAGQLTELASSGLAYTAYSQNAAGRAFFMSDVKPAMDSACSNCHSISYDQQWSSLILPAPAKGGTATNNLLINKPSGTVAHDPGNVCGGVNNGVCGLLQQWWDLEFGQL
jgi:hypothetical protein